MKKTIFLILAVLCFIFLTACNGSNTENNINDTNENTNTNNLEDNPNNLSKDDFKISKETLKALFVDLYMYEDMNIEYITTKDYLFDEDGKLIDTEYSVDGIVYIYDGMNDDRSNIIDERPLTEEDDKLFEYHNSQYYLKNFDDFLNYFKDPGNTVDPQGEVTLDDEGRVIKDKYKIEAGNVIVDEYEYDDQGRLITIIRNSDDDFYSTSSFTYDEHDRVVKVVWRGGELGYRDTYYTYNDIGLLVELFRSSRSDTRDGMDYTVYFEYVEK